MYICFPVLFSFHPLIHVSCRFKYRIFEDLQKTSCIKIIVQLCTLHSFPYRMCIFDSYINCLLCLFFAYKCSSSLLTENMILVCKIYEFINSVQDPDLEGSLYYSISEQYNTKFYK